MLHPFVPDLASIIHRFSLQRDAFRFRSYLHRSGLESHTSLENYLASSSTDVSDKTPIPDRVLSSLVPHHETSWNHLITGYVKNGEPKRALAMYKDLEMDSSIQFNGYAYVALLKACATLKDLGRGTDIHAAVVRTGLLDRDLYVGSILVDMYAKCGSISKAQEVFDHLPKRNVVVCNTLMAAYAKEGYSEQVFACFLWMQQEDVSPDAVSYVCILKACSSIQATEIGCQIHSEIERKGLLQGCIEVGSALVDMYMKCGFLAKAQEVFDKIPTRNVVLWTALILGYVEEGLAEEAFEYFNKMQHERIPPNDVTFVSILKACGSIAALDKGQEIHADIVRRNLLGRENVGNTLVDMYAKCGMLIIAQEVLVKLPVRNIISWTALIAGHVEHGYGEEALKCFDKACTEGFTLDAATYVCAFKACGDVGALEKGEEIYAELDRNSSRERNHLVDNSLIEMYAKCGALYKAKQVFDKLTNPDIHSWNNLLTGYAELGHDREVLDCFEEMKLKCVAPDSLTFACILRSCGNMRAIDKGQEIHDAVERKGLLETDPIVSSYVVDMFMKCGSIDKAQEVFDKIPVHDLVSWMALMTGYVENGHGNEALNCLGQMTLEGLSPDAFTYVSSLKACGCMGDKDMGYRIHATVERKGLPKGDAVVGNALVDMYAKCGSIDEAQKMFDGLTVHDIVSWNSLISGYAEYGHVGEAFKCFKQMESDGLCGDKVTFVCLLKACGSIGDIDRGQDVHLQMEKTGVEEGLVVGNTLVDMYIKCNLLDKAQQVFDKLEVPDLVSWTSLMAGYAEHGLGVKALKCFENLQLDVVVPDLAVYVCSLKALGSIGATNKGQELHALSVTKGLFETDLAFHVALVDMYAKCGFLSEARHAFDKISAPNVVSWTALITGYVEHGHGDQALELFEQMQVDGVGADVLTYACGLKACGSTSATEKGIGLHAEIERAGWLHGDPVVGNSLIEMYAKCGCLANAQQVFDKLLVKDTTSWNALITGYTEHGHGKDALNCFKQMQLEGFYPNSVTFVYSLIACKSIGSMERGQEVHGGILQKELFEDEVRGKALVDMCAKCGCFDGGAQSGFVIDRAQSGIDKLPNRNLTSWNILMAAYAQLGKKEDLFSVFQQMIGEGVIPYPEFFVVILNACNNKGLCGKNQIFQATSKEHVILAMLEHHLSLDI